MPFRAPVGLRALGSSEKGAFGEAAGFPPESRVDPPQIQASSGDREVGQQAQAHSAFLQRLSPFPMTVVRKQITNSVASNHRKFFSLVLEARSLNGS